MFIVVRSSCKQTTAGAKNFGDNVINTNNYIRAIAIDAEKHHDDLSSLPKVAVPHRHNEVERGRGKLPSLDI